MSVEDDFTCPVCGKSEVRILRPINDPKAQPRIECKNCGATWQIGGITIDGVTDYGKVNIHYDPYEVFGQVFNHWETIHTALKEARENKEKEIMIMPHVHMIYIGKKAYNYSADSCPFCRIFWQSCDKCPYYRITGRSCGSPGSHWRNFAGVAEGYKNGNRRLQTVERKARELLEWLSENKERIIEILKEENGGEA